MTDYTEYSYLVKLTGHGWGSDRGQIVPAKFTAHDDYGYYDRYQLDRGYGGGNMTFAHTQRDCLFTVEPIERAAETKPDPVSVLADAYLSLRQLRDDARAELAAFNEEHEEVLEKRSALDKRVYQLNSLVRELGYTAEEAGVQGVESPLSGPVEF